MKTLVLSLEPSRHYPEHSASATELIPYLRSALDDSLDHDYVFETLPFLYEEASSAAVGHVVAHEPEFVFLLTNEPNHLEILLHRYAAHRYEVDFPDNDGKTGVALDPESVPRISKSEVFRLHGHWMEHQADGLAHVTLATAGDGGVESETYRGLMDEFDGTEMVLARLGVPPIAPQHAILGPETLARTLAFLMEAEYRFQAES